MRIRIVVADQSEARFYDAEQRDTRRRSVGALTDPLAHRHDRDFKSDRPGRVYDHAPDRGGTKPSSSPAESPPRSRGDTGRTSSTG